jgi:23S rRNA (cytidine2498-2'-O)-methyltransferase
VVRLAGNLRKGGLVVFTLKFSRVERVSDPLTLMRNIVKLAADSGLRLFAQTHLTYNGYEFTLFFEKTK